MKKLGYPTITLWLVKRNGEITDLRRRNPSYNRRKICGFEIAGDINDLP